MRDLKTSTRSIAVTAGEPAGIGPDLLILLAQRAREVPLVAYTDPDCLLQRASTLNLELKLQDYEADRAPSCEAHRLTIYPVPFPRRIRPGNPSVENVPALLESIRQATQAAMTGIAHALVTGPVHKSVIAKFGIPFSGHTEMLAELAGVEEVTMLLASEKLRVGLATRHLPLTQVPRALTQAGLETTLRILDAGLRQRFGIREPRTLVAGLNPHAGEDGYLGREEIEIISPTISRLRQEGLNIDGPFPADSLFSPAKRSQADAILAMYHDQGLAPFKALSFGEAVNVTLGLPFVRTSVDHGTALDLAGTGKVDTGSLEAAIQLAARLI